MELHNYGERRNKIHPLLVLNCVNKSYLLTVLFSFKMPLLNIHLVEGHAFHILELNYAYTSIKMLLSNQGILLSEGTKSIIINYKDKILT